MTEPAPRRRPGAPPVYRVALLLFCVLLGFLAYRFSIGADPSGVGASAAPAPPVRKVIVRRVVTTVVPAAGAAQAPAAAPVGEAPVPASEAVPVSAPVTASS